MWINICYHRYMITTILTIFVTWLMTMLYYTDRYKKVIKESNLVRSMCSHCSIDLFLSKENLRVVNFCNNCK